MQFLLIGLREMFYRVKIKNLQIQVIDYHPVYYRQKLSGYIYDRYRWMDGWIDTDRYRWMDGWMDRKSEVIWRY